MYEIQGSVIALATFMLINSITPGPNNLMLLQGGLKKGFWGCRAHILGISSGVTIMLWLSYWGMASLVVDHPTLMLAIRVLGSAYLLWLAYHMAKSDFVAVVEQALQSQAVSQSSVDTASIRATSSIAIDETNEKQRFGELPLTFWQAVLFQWLNPKAWTMTMLAPPIAFIYVTGSQGLGFGLDNLPLLLMCMVINVVCISFWAAGGQWLRRLIHKPKVMRWVQAIIVLMVVYCALALWL